MNSNINNYNNNNKTHISNYFINNNKTIIKKTLNSNQNNTLKDYTLFNIV